MGAVFQVEDPRLDRRVALKVLRRDGDTQETLSKRFDSEARITGQLEHPSIPPVYEYGEAADGSPYLALRLLNGETLESVIERLKEGDSEAHQRYTFPERVRICIQITEALLFAHNRGILHRDVKPENIMLGASGEVWLLDWGVAGPPSEGAPSEEDVSTRITEEPTFLGTLLYAAPEQLAGTYSSATDQYSLGAVFYEFFCLHPAHRGDSRMEVLTAVVNTTPKAAERFFHSTQGRVPRELSVLFQKMLQKEPPDRFDSLGDVLRELKIVAGGDIRAICPHTLTKKLMYRAGRHFDNYGYWLMPMALLWLLYPLYALIDMLVGRLWT